MDTIAKLLELIQFGDEPIDFELKNQKLDTKYCGFDCYRWTPRDSDTYISCYRYRKENIRNSFVCLDINLRSDKTVEFIKKLKEQFEVVEWAIFKEAKLNEKIMSLNINKNPHVDFLKVSEILIGGNQTEITTSSDTVSIQIVWLLDS